MNALELRIPPAAVALLVAAAMWLVSVLAPGFSWQFPGYQVIALVLVVAGIGTAGSGIVSFRRAGTTIDPTRPHAASLLVNTGIYRFSRNPMYLGVLLALIGWALYWSNLLALVFAPVFVAYMNRFQIMPEERMLSRMFGPEFTAYKQEVRRWV